MPGEAHLTYRFKKALEAVTGFDGVPIKHSDKFTSGVPDYSHTFNGSTLWLEFKRRPEGHTGDFASLLRATNRRSKIQMFTLWRLDRSSKGRALYVVFEPKRKVSLVRVTNPSSETFEHVMTGSQEQVITTLLSLCQ